MSKLEGYEKGSLAPVTKCARCDKQARLTVENSLMAGLGSNCNLCVECAVRVCNELGDSLGAQVLDERMRAL